MPRPCWRASAGYRRPAQPGGLLGAVWYEPERRRPAGFSHTRHLPDWREKYHSSLLADQLTTLNPLVNERIQAYTQLYKSLIGDSALLSTQAITQLQTVTALEANILAYNDTYLLTASIAAATLVWILWRLLRLRITAQMALKNATGNK